MTVQNSSRTCRPLIRRHTTVLLCAAAVLAMPGPADPAAAQSAGAFQGSISSSTGRVGRTITGATTETITVATPSLTINWTPFDGSSASGPIVFLPQGHVATFTNDPLTAPNFTVLNRITPTDPSRPIALNGTVISQLQDLSGNVTTGGRVWFYSPGGILVGASAVFDVGGLVLTVNDPVSFSASDGGFTGQFARSDSNAAVVIEPGAQIGAMAADSYLAIVAPRIEQGGTVTVNGSAAFVAAEQATLIFNQGLFDISVDVGTGDLNGIVHTGTTGGPASLGAGDPHRIVMVAVPKNQALTMLLSGHVGFEPAAEASVENGEIVLRAASNGEARGNIEIGSGTYSSNLLAEAAGDVHLSATNGSIVAQGLEAIAGGAILIDGTSEAVVEAATIALQGESVTSELTLTAQTVEVSAAGDLAVHDVLASASAAFEAGGTASFFGLVSAPQISVSSSDLNIGEGGQLGEAGVTESLEIVALSAGADILIGGEQAQSAAIFAASAPQYHLSQDEADRIEASSITFTASGIGDVPTPDVVIGDLEIGGSLTPGGGVSSVLLQTDGSVVVLGQLLYGNAASGDNLSIEAGQKILVDTSSGGFIAMFSGAEGSEAPAGNLAITAADIWVGSSSLISNLTSNPNFAGLDEQLITNPDAFDPIGHIAAGGVSFLAGNSFFLQNSGSASEFAGITVGGGGLSIATGQTAKVIAFGQGLGSGGAITGVDFFHTVNFNFAQGSSYTDDSKFNNISINLGPQSPPPPPQPLSITFGGHGAILGGVEMPLGGSESAGDEISWADDMDGGIPLSSAFREIADLLDEAVTSGGDSNLWIDDEEEDNGEEAPNLGE